MSNTAGQSLLYNRRGRIAIVPKGSTKALSYGNLTADDVPLRMGFSIERSLSGKADKAKVAITNLNEANRAAMVKDSQVAVTAGYDARSGLLFTGFVDKVKTTRNGPDIVTELECADGQFNVQYATVNRAYSEPVTLARILQDLASDLNLVLDGGVVSVAPGIIKGLPDESFARGLTLDGPVSFWLNLLLRPRLIDWTIQNGRLLILPRYVTTSIQPCVVLSQSTGMLDTPSFSEKGLTVSSLLNSDILPGRLLQVVSKNSKVAGFYKVQSCKYDGDTHDQAWRVECECEAITDTVQVLPLATPQDFSKAVV